MQSPINTSFALISNYLQKKGKVQETPLCLAQPFFFIYYYYKGKSNKRPFALLSSYLKNKKGKVPTTTPSTFLSNEAREKKGELEHGDYCSQKKNET